MEPKKLSTLINELVCHLKDTGDGFIEGYNDHDATVPFVLWSEDDKQYYVDFAEEDDEDNPFYAKDDVDEEDDEVEPGDNNVDWKSRIASEVDPIDDQLIDAYYDEFPSEAIHE